MSTDARVPVMLGDSLSARVAPHGASYAKLSGLSDKTPSRIGAASAADANNAIQIAAAMNPALRLQLSERQTPRTVLDSVLAVLKQQAAETKVEQMYREPSRLSVATSFRSANLSHAMSNASSLHVSQQGFDAVQDRLNQIMSEATASHMNTQPAYALAEDREKARSQQRLNAHVSRQNTAMPKQKHVDENSPSSPVVNESQLAATLSLPMFNIKDIETSNASVVAAAAKVIQAQHSQSVLTPPVLTMSRQSTRSQNLTPGQMSSQRLSSENVARLMRMADGEAPETTQEEAAVSQPVFPVTTATSTLKAQPNLGLTVDALLSPRQMHAVQSASVSVQGSSQNQSNETTSDSRSYKRVSSWLHSASDQTEGVEGATKKSTGSLMDAAQDFLKQLKAVEPAQQQSNSFPVMSNNNENNQSNPIITLAADDRSEVVVVPVHEKTDKQSQHSSESSNLHVAEMQLNAPHYGATGRSMSFNHGNGSSKVGLQRDNIGSKSISNDGEHSTSAIPNLPGMIMSSDHSLPEQAGETRGPASRGILQRRNTTNTTTSNVRADSIGQHDSEPTRNSTIIQHTRNITSGGRKHANTTESKWKKVFADREANEMPRFVYLDLMQEAHTVVKSIAERYKKDVGERHELTNLANKRAEALKEAIDKQSVNWHRGDLKFGV